MTAFMKCSGNTAAGECRRAHGQISCLYNHDEYNLRLEKSSWQKAGAEAQTFNVADCGRTVPHMLISTGDLAASLAHKLLLHNSLWAPRLVCDSYHTPEQPWLTEYHIKVVQVTAAAAERPVYYTPYGRIRSEGEDRLVYTLSTTASPVLQH